MYGPTKLFHKATAFKKADVLLDRAEWPQEWTTITFKQYPRSRRIQLPASQQLTGASLDDTLRKRRSARDFDAKRPIAGEALSTLLAYSCGLLHPPHSPRYFFRSYPSAGARYPLEIYPIVRRSDAVPPGIYHYNLPAHELELIRSSNFLLEIQAALAEEWTTRAAGFILISAVFDRMMVKYHEQGYRFILEEVGAVLQNIYLVATALGMGSVAIGGFVERTVNQLLDFDGTTEAAAGLVALGHEWQADGGVSSVDKSLW